ncbi:MAG: response regulator [Cyanobacteria bacterium J06626_6]
MRILLVDDDETLMESLAERLIQQRYAVDIATDGSSAQTYADLFSYDLIVLDLMLPDGDGIQFCQALRQDGYSNPLMILTAKESTAEKVKALDAGADDYVVKPFDFDELCARIRALLRREHQGLPTVLTWGALSLDPSTCETTYRDQPIRLTPKEFSMMELFLRHPHRVYSLGAIIDDLWSFEDPPGEDAVRTHIKGLRRKLKAVGAPKDLIKTVYGLGYRLNENTHWPSEQANRAVRQKTDAQKNARKGTGSELVSNSPEPSLAQNVYPRAAEQPAKRSSQTPEQQAFANREPGMRPTGPSIGRSQLIDTSDSGIQPSNIQPPKIAPANALSFTEQLAQACHRYLSSASQQIAVLEKGAAALADGTIQPELYRNSRISAHKLAGSLGSYGFLEGSQIARKVEIQLQSISITSSPASPPTPPEKITESAIGDITYWVGLLRQSIDQATVQTATTALSNTLRESTPLLLIVTEDDRLSQALVAQAAIAQFQTQVVSTAHQAIQTIRTAEKPDLVLLDIATKQNQFTDLIEILKQDHALPVVVLGNQLPLKRRHQLVKQGVEIVTTRTLAPREIMASAAQIIKAETSQIRVAIADDDPQMLTLLKTSLALWGFQVITFRNAMDLWHWLIQPEAPIRPAVDILVLDVEMPDLDGISLCRIIRADARFQALPILFLTHHREESTRMQAFQSGADDFVHKAVAPAELATRLRNQLVRACQLPRLPASG